MIKGDYRLLLVSLDGKAPSTKENVFVTGLNSGSSDGLAYAYRISRMLIAPNNSLTLNLC